MTRYWAYVLGALLVVGSAAAWSISCRHGGATLEDACEKICSCSSSNFLPSQQRACVLDCSRSGSGPNPPNVPQVCLDCIADATCMDLSSSGLGVCGPACSVGSGN